MITVGLRELRQQASELVRRVEGGEEITITVSGRPSARMVPIAPGVWQVYDDIADLFTGPPDEAWVADRDRVDHTLRDPWASA